MTFISTSQPLACIQGCIQGPKSGPVSPSLVYIQGFAVWTIRNPNTHNRLQNVKFQQFNATRLLITQYKYIVAKQYIALFSNCLMKTIVVASGLVVIVDAVDMRRTEFTGHVRREMSVASAIIWIHATRRYDLCRIQAAIC